MTLIRWQFSEIQSQLIIYLPLEISQVLLQRLASSKREVLKREISILMVREEATISSWLEEPSPTLES